MSVRTLVAFLLLTALPAWAQLPAGRVSGRVIGPDDRPIAGAEVRVWPAADPDNSVSEVVTDADGRWRVIGLGLGRWQLEITAAGYFPAEGWFQIVSSNPEATVDVELRTLEETSPSFAENASTVVRWIEKGNALLEQGQPAAARAEYQKALRVLPREQRPEVLQAVARTHFMEGDTDSSIERLVEALTISPEDPILERLFFAVLERAGRRGEATALLEEAAAAATAEPVAAAEPTGGLPELSPLVAPVEGRTGRFRTAFEERSPLSGPETYSERFRFSEEEMRAVDPEGGVYDLREESFELFVPESYDSDEPHGLLVWISPTPYGGFRNPEFERVLAEHRMIWIGAHDSGNRRRGWYRVGLALDAVHNAKRLYSIDRRRVYVAGYSGGGRIASSLAMLYPVAFTGGFFLYGCDYFEQLPVPHRPGSFWPARFARPSGMALDQLKAEARFVLLTGDADFNRSQTRQIYKRMRASGFAHLTYLQIPGADHYFGLPPEWLKRGLAALDQPRE